MHNIDYYHQIMKEVSSMPDWAILEQLYNCDTFFDSATKNKGSREIRFIGDELRKGIAKSLRAAADILDPVDKIGHYNAA